MNNLFSIFDPYTSHSFPWGWCALFSVLTLRPNLFWANQSRASSGLPLLKKLCLNEFAPSFPQSANPSSMIILLCLFISVFTMNFLGLMPLVFTPTSHIAITLPLAMTLFTGYMSQAISKTSLPTLAHLTPSGAPLPLGPFLVIVESISSLIRPITLSVRLAANMVAGHLLLNLLGTSVSSAPSSTGVVLMFMLVILLLLEVAVAFIQTYVFTMLSSLYIAEVESQKL